MFCFFYISKSKILVAETCKKPACTGTTCPKYEPGTSGKAANLTVRIFYFNCLSEFGSVRTRNGWFPWMGRMHSWRWTIRYASRTSYLMWTRLISTSNSRVMPSRRRRTHGASQTVSCSELQSIFVATASFQMIACSILIWYCPALMRLRVSLSTKLLIT